MKDPRNREMMAQLYRLYERYEVPKEDESYWLSLVNECNTLCAAWESPVLTCLCGGLVDGLERLRLEGQK